MTEAQIALAWADAWVKDRNAEITRLKEENDRLQGELDKLQGLVNQYAFIYSLNPETMEDEGMEATLDCAHDLLLMAAKL